MANNTIKRTWNQGSMVTIEDLLGMTFQAESGGHTFVISGVDADGNAVALSGTPSGVMLRPDDTDQALTCSVSGGKVYATLPAGCYDVPGRAGITIFLTDNGQKVAIYAAVVSISRTQSGTVAPGTTASVVDLINAINAAIAGIPATDTALKAAMAPTYSTSGLYAVGAYSWYNGTLYRCTTPITTAETWTPGHWTAAALGNDVSDLKSAFNNYVLFDKIAMANGAKVSQSSSQITDSSYNMFRCCDIPYYDATMFLHAYVTIENNTDKNMLAIIIARDASDAQIGSSGWIVIKNQDDLFSKVSSYLTNAKSVSLTIAFSATTAASGIVSGIDAFDYNIFATQFILPDNADVSSLLTDVSALNTKVGNTALPTTAPTVTGAIAEHEEDITDINSELDRLIEKSTIDQYTELSPTGGDTININQRWFLNFETPIAKDTYIDSIELYCTRNDSQQASGVIEFWNLVGNNLVRVRSVNFSVDLGTGNDMVSIATNYKTTGNAYVSVCMGTIPSGYTSDVRVLIVSGEKAYFYRDGSSTTLNYTTPDSLSGYTLGYIIHLSTIEAQGYTPYYITVAKDGSGDYTTIQNAVNNATNGDTIFIRSGVYDEHVDTLGKTLYLIGEDKFNCVIHSVSGNYQTPPLIFSSGSVQNLTIYAEKNENSTDIPDANTVGAYAIHLDDQYMKYKSQFINNCILKSDFFPAIGIGTQPECNIEISDCELISNQIVGVGSYASQGSLGALYFHDYGIGDTEQRITVKNNIIHSALANAMCVYALLDGTTTTKKCIATFVNNVLYSDANGKSNNIWFRNITTPFGGNIVLNPLSDENNNALLNGN